MLLDVIEIKGEKQFALFDGLSACDMCFKAFPIQFDGIDAT